MPPAVTSSADRFALYAPFTKVAPTSDGGRELWGFAWMEMRDHAGEIADFVGNVEQYQQWSDELQKSSGGKNKGNIREQHGLRAIGKVIDWRVVDDAKTGQRGIYHGVYIPPTEHDVLTKLDAGIYTGFSMGGSYKKRWYDPDARAHRYVGEFQECSVVDRPGIPGAVIDLMKSDSMALALRKAASTDNGQSEQGQLRMDAQRRAKQYGIEHRGALTPPRGFPAVEAQYGDPVNYRYPVDRTHIRAALSYFNRAGQRVKGGYSTAEWEVVGKRIATAANRLLGQGYSYSAQSGAITTPNSTAEHAADKAAVLTTLMKAATAGALSFEDITSLVRLALWPPAGPGQLEDIPSEAIAELYVDHVIIQNWDTDQFWSIPYTIDGDHATLGERVPVSQEWAPIAKGAGVMLRKAASDTKDETKDEPKDETKDETKDEPKDDTKDEPKGAADDDGVSPQDKAVSQKIESLTAMVAGLTSLVRGLAAAQRADEKSGMDDDDMAKAAQAVNLLSGLTAAPALRKDGRAISTHNAHHLGHAIDHIHHAMGHDEQVVDGPHISDDRAPSRSSTADTSEDDKPMEKAATAAELGRIVRGAVSSALTEQASQPASTSELTTLLKTVTDRLDGLQQQVTAIAKTPMGGGPIISAGAAMAASQPVSDPAMLEYQTTTDPLRKASLGGDLAYRQLVSQLRATPPPNPMAAPVRNPAQ